jgi:hypothetical protein
MDLGELPPSLHFFHHILNLGEEAGFSHRLFGLVFSIVFLK